MAQLLVLLVFALLAALWYGREAAARAAAGAPRPTLAELLSGPWPAAACGVAAALIAWYVWGSLSAAPVVHDEMSYLLQAQLFAQGRLVAPAPPLPAFFEQYHVLVSPVFASKYPPGHALLLVPGVWLGAPGLVPVLLTGLSGALLFALARRAANGWVALLTFVLWLAAWDTLRFRPSYLSQTTTSALWLAGWWALWAWHDTGRRGWLLALAACTGWGAITRPLTMLAFAVPVGAVVLVLVARRRRWRDLAAAVAVGLACLAVLALWNQRTTGSWRAMSWSAYSRQYTPWDRMGFGYDSTPPARALPPDMRRFAEGYRPIHTAFTPAQVPAALRERVRMLRESTLGGERGWIAPFALAGTLMLLGGAYGAAGVMALLGALAMLAAHLVKAHAATWSVYYLEIDFLLPFAAAAGLWWAASALVALASTRRWRALRDPRMLRPAASLRAPAALPVWAVALAALLLAAQAPRRVQIAERANAWRRSYNEQWMALLSRLPSARSVVFVRYGSDHNPHASLIFNEGDLARAAVWVVYDRGAENAALLARAPDRVPYLFDEASGTIAMLPHATPVRQAAR